MNKVHFKTMFNITSNITGTTLTALNVKNGKSADRSGIIENLEISSISISSLPHASSLFAGIGTFTDGNLKVHAGNVSTNAIGNSTNLNFVHPLFFNKGDVVVFFFKSTGSGTDEIICTASGRYVSIK